MFDRIYRQGNSYSHKTVEINRAPTDESVRLLKEMEGAARAKVLNAYSVDNVLKVTLVEWQELPEIDSTEVLALFSINGERIQTRVSSEIGRLMRRAKLGSDDATREAYRLLFKALAEDIAERLMEKVLTRAAGL